MEINIYIFLGYQPYEFTFVKELKGSSLKLVSEKDEKAAEENAPK